MHQKDPSCFFIKKCSRLMKVSKDAKKYFNKTNSSYLLEVSNKTGSIFMLNQKELCVLNPTKLEEVLNSEHAEKIYAEYSLGREYSVEFTMARLSPCEKWMAIVMNSKIVVIYLPDFLAQKKTKVLGKNFATDKDFTYLEWSPLNELYHWKRHFLTLDSSGRLRTHFVSDQFMCSDPEKKFRCATYSLDGSMIYAISYYQELFLLDPLNVQIISKRRIDQLGESSEILSMRMMQIDPKIMVIGSLCRASKEPIENSVPHLLVLTGDLLDPEAEVNLVSIKMNSSEKLDRNKLPDFRFHYVKERQLLLFSHTESSSVQALQFAENGDFVELDSLNLNDSTVRGFVFYQGTFSIEEKSQMVQVEYQNQSFVLPNCPRILVFDSKGFMHHFNYYDRRYTEPGQSILVDPIRVKELHERILLKDRPLFEHQGLSKSIRNWGFTSSEKNVDNLYMLDFVDDIGQALVVYKERCGFASLDKLNQMLEAKSVESGFDEYQAEEKRGDIRMVKVSNCKYLVAMVHESVICIQKTNVFLETNAENQQDRKLETEFTLAEGVKYSSLEWPPLNHTYIEKPYFLTQDEKGILRIHYVNAKMEKVIGQGEIFRCGTFSLDGKNIFAINEKQEICQIDLRDSRIVMKRTINELSNAEEVRSSHIQQLAPRTFVIGSIVKVENEENNLNPYLHVISGDLSDPNIDLSIKKYEMPFLTTIEARKPVMFKFLFVKERQLLLFGHSGSNKIRGLRFQFDGSQIEVDGFSLGNLTLRGLVFVKKERFHQNPFPALKSQILVLDSKGYLHHYSDAYNSVPVLPRFKKFLSMDKFLQKREFLKAKLIPKKRSRGKSQCRKREVTSLIVQKKTRSKSLMRRILSPEETKALREEIQKKIELRKNQKALEESQKKLNENKVPANPFLSVKTTKSEFSGNLFLSIKKNKNESSENPFLTFKNTGSTQLNSVVFTDLSKNNLFANVSLFKKEPEPEAKSSLFTNHLFVQKKEPESEANKLFAFKKEPEKNANNLLSTISKPKSLQKMFDFPEDSLKKTRLLFLNKFESDITFKVEDQEFPAHKSIVSEGCRFFNNMFASGMSESRSEVIEIPDTKASVFKAFLMYVYQGKVDLNEEFVAELYEFSERYMLDELKEACENYLGSNLTVDNCFKVFELANRESGFLRHNVMVFFRLNLQKILERKDLDDLPKSSCIFIKRMEWALKEVIF